MPFPRTVLCAACLACAALLAVPAAHSQVATASAVPQPMLAPLDQAHTFAQVRRGDTVSTLLVLTLGAGKLSAVDLSALSGLHGVDAFDVINRFDAAALDALARDKRAAREYRFEHLLGVGPRGLAHIAAGTNYPAHGEEVGIGEAFLFPKIAQAGAPRTTVASAPADLLDYEVEICARFDRELRSLADFDAARKGFFLCGDFTSRATLVRNINLKDIASGDGFADAKAGRDRFPAGPFLVVPRDWKTFLNGVTIATHVNGEPRQQARGGDMIKDLRAIVGETLDGAATRSWSFQGARVPMVARAAIGTETAVLTGTGEGVVFQEPGADVMQEVMGAKGRSAQQAVIERYLAAEAARRIYLQPGNQVRHASNVLGWIDATVVAVGK